MGHLTARIRILNNFSTIDFRDKGIRTANVDLYDRALSRVINFMNTCVIENKIHNLPIELQSEVNDYIDFLLSKKGLNHKSSKIQLDWAGGLKEYCSKFKSVELQHKSSEWWGNSDFDKTDLVKLSPKQATTLLLKK